MKIIFPTLYRGWFISLSQQCCKNAVLPKILSIEYYTEFWWHTYFSVWQSSWTICFNIFCRKFCKFIKHCAWIAIFLSQNCLSSPVSPFSCIKAVLFKTNEHSFISHEPLSFCSFLLMSSLFFLSLWEYFLVGDHICCSLHGTDFLHWLHFNEDWQTTTANIIKNEGVIRAEIWKS